MAQIHVCWNEDSSGELTLHRNGPGMASETWLGTVSLRGASFVATVSGSTAGPKKFATQTAARQFVQDAVGGKLVDEW